MFAGKPPSPVWIFSGTRIAHNPSVSKLTFLLSFPHLGKRFWLMQMQTKMILNKKIEKNAKKRTKNFTLGTINNDK